MFNLMMMMMMCAQVWKIRVDVHTLNNDGNLMDAASIAAIAALSHFRRPDVGVQGEEVTVVSDRASSCDLDLSPALPYPTCLFGFLFSVQSRRERPHPSEYLPHAHQRQLCLLPAGVRVHTVGAQSLCLGWLSATVTPKFSSWVKLTPHTKKKKTSFVHFALMWKIFNISKAIVAQMKSFLLHKRSTDHSAFGFFYVGGADKRTCSLIGRQLLPWSSLQNLPAGGPVRAGGASDGWVADDRHEQTQRDLLHPVQRGHHAAQGTGVKKIYILMKFSEIKGNILNFLYFCPSCRRLCGAVK